MVIRVPRPPAPPQPVRGRQIFQNVPLPGQAPTGAAPQRAAAAPDVVVGRGPELAAAREHALNMYKRSSEAPLPKTGNAIEGLGYVANFGIAGPLQSRFAADAEREKQQAIIDAMISDGTYTPEQAAVIAGGGVAGQSLAQSINAREQARRRLADEIKLLEKKKELGVGVGAKTSSYYGQRFRTEVTDPKTGETKSIWVHKNLRTGEVEPLKLPDGGEIVSDEDAERRKYKAREEGRGEGRAKEPYTKALVTGTTILKLIGDLEDDPRTKKYVGMLQDNIPVLTEDAAGWKATTEQLLGQTFLTAFDQLRGGGQITNTEGEKATKAYARLTQSQSYPEYMAALNDLRRIVNLGITRAKADMGDKDALRKLEEEFGHEESIRRYEVRKAENARLAEERAQKLGRVPAKPTSEAARDRAEGTPPQPTAEDVKRAWKQGDEVAPGIVFKGPSGR